MFKLLVSSKKRKFSLFSSEVKFLQAIIMWISVLLIRRTEGYRIPLDRLTLPANDDDIGRLDWGDGVDGIPSISNDIDQPDIENSAILRNESFDFMAGKIKRNSLGKCGCPAQETSLKLDENDHLLGIETYPPLFKGIECQKGTNSTHCAYGSSCQTIRHKIHILRFKIGHNEPHKTALHFSLRKNFYWHEYVS